MSVLHTGMLQYRADGGVREHRVHGNLFLYLGSGLWRAAAFYSVMKYRPCGSGFQATLPSGKMPLSQKKFQLP